jgi:hypothetical protein
LMRLIDVLRQYRPRPDGAYPLRDPHTQRAVSVQLEQLRTRCGIQ